MTSTVQKGIIIYVRHITCLLNKQMGLALSCLGLSGRKEDVQIEIKMGV